MKVLFSLVILVIAWNPGFSQNTGEDMDRILQKELGLDPDQLEQKKSSPNSDGSKTGNRETNNPKSDKPKSDNPKSDREEPNNQNSGSDTDREASNPVRDRYGSEEDSSGTIWILLKVILVFGGLTLVMVYILKVMARTRNSRFPVQGVMSILSSMPLGTNKQIQLVEVSDRLLVLGVADQSINLIAEITDMEEKSRILKQKEEFDPVQENFLVTLLETLKDFRPSPQSDKEKEFSHSDDEEILELERKHQMTIERLKSTNKQLGMDPGGAG